MELYSLLKNKKILEILDGDKSYGEYHFEDGSAIPISMPYLSGPQLCDLSTSFGLGVTYSYGGGSLSRWQYLENLLTYCIDNNKCSKLLTHLFSKNQFAKCFEDRGREETNQAYEKIINVIIDKINGILCYGEAELIKDNNGIIVRPIGVEVQIKIPHIKAVDREYIKDISERAMKDIEQGNYDSAITKARTLLEEIFIYGIEQKGEKPNSSGDIGKLHKQVKSLYNMHVDKNIDERIVKLLSGLNNIVSSIAEMRNIGSDAHGVGIKRMRLNEHHARLFVNSAIIMSEFIIAVSQTQHIDKNSL